MGEDGPRKKPGGDLRFGSAPGKFDVDVHVALGEIALREAHELRRDALTVEIGGRLVGRLVRDGQHPGVRRVVADRFRREGDERVVSGPVMAGRRQSRAGLAAGRSEGQSQLRVAGE